MKPLLVKMQQNWTLLKDDQEQFKAGVSFQEYVLCDNDDVTCKVQTLEQMMVGEVNLQQDFCQHWRVATLRKYIMFGVLITGCLSSVVVTARCAGSGENEEVANYCNGHVEKVQ